MTTIHDAIENYLRDAQVGLLPRSIETYAQGLARFTEYLEREHIALTADCSTLSVEHAIACARELSERGIAKPTLRTYISAIANLYAWLLLHDLIDLSAHDAERMRVTFRKFRKNGGRRMPKLPTEDTVNELIAAARNAEIAPSKSKPTEERRKLAKLRNLAIVLALRASGMRVGELVRLKRGDLNYDTASARVTGKGNDQRIVYFDKPAMTAIREYLNSRGDGASGRALNELPLFAQHGKRGATRVLSLTTHHIRTIFTAIATSAGIAPTIPITPHWLRHHFATKVLDATGDLSVVQDMLGHKSPETTRIYAEVSSKRLRQAHRIAFDDGENRNEGE